MDKMIEQLLQDNAKLTEDGTKKDAEIAELGADRFQLGRALRAARFTALASLVGLLLALVLGGAVVVSTMGLEHERNELRESVRTLARDAEEGIIAAEASESLCWSTWRSLASQRDACLLREHYSK